MEIVTDKFPTRQTIDSSFVHGTYWSVVFRTACSSSSTNCYANYYVSLICPANVNSKSLSELTPT